MLVVVTRVFAKPGPVSEKIPPPGAPELAT